MKLKEKLQNIKEFPRLCIFSSCFALLGLLIIIPLCATSVIKWGWTYGFIFGSTINFLMVFLNFKKGLRVAKADPTKKGNMALAIFDFVLTTLIVVGALLLGALVQYTWNRPDILSLFGIFVALLPMQLVMVLNYWINK